MGQPAAGQASRDKMARNSKQLMERFTFEGWRATKYASAANTRSCSGKTKSGDECLRPVGYGALKDSSARPDGMTRDSDMVFYCHFHATEVLEAEIAERMRANGFA